ncbi:uncharacterized protein L969DRAFT_43901 [Mixia osmundae IAM 14324]|uniref:Delta(14)-sterol reductase ERG24 n=1 Tax=Mixia osmundae (strain CBS 9802 / IAM 14324 / JCM 22182 / KY 12970) TaxID=764103 RepID=G7DT59_MIXOS|nr:uncharacterized protein L969DRAFT_43901 [Mixia osmundae IAM 14324]KEI42728.1 hypothetical protein L969DRAFT_43901 [Mixia osmundae IAM 14324]GAA93938.1 hypothetical protein E5Q_00584 [Mixia osmundae IAM 14324]
MVLTRSRSIKGIGAVAAGEDRKLIEPTEDPEKIGRAKYEAAPRSLHYEFGGPIGALGVTTAVPFFSYWLGNSCTASGCPPMPLDRYFSQGWQAMQTSSYWLGLWDTQAAYVYLGWYAWVVLAWYLLPGKWIDGGALRDGTKLTYKQNAFVTLLASIALWAGAVAVLGADSMLFVYDHWQGLVTASLVMSVAQAFFVHFQSFREDTMCAEGGNTGNALYDWFIGRALNPRIGSFDIKTFNEIRPGLILWLLLDLALAAKQYADIGRVTDSMVLVVLFHAVYVFDALYNEAAILTQMDITTDGFGFMLSVGDLTWVPFTYGLQAKYLAAFPKDLGYLGTAGVLAVNFLGYWIFRDSNGEKNDFRNGKNPKNLTSMKTKRGTALLTSGWWGLCRHPNYLGDLIMAVSWCLPTGFDTPLTYFYPVYFLILLVHRQMRDDHACAKKYGADWDRYVKLVPSRILPGVY